MIERIYRVVSSQTNVKWVFVEILDGHGQPQKFIGWAQPFLLLTLFTSDIGSWKIWPLKIFWEPQELC